MAANNTRMYDLCRYSGKKIIRPSLKLIGGKTHIRDVLYPHFPAHEAYFEPFCGTGGVLIGKPRSEREVVGDLNEYLINYYHVIQEQPREFFELMFEEWYSLVNNLYPWEIFEDWKKEVIRCPELPLRRAVLFYLITKHCYNGIWRLNKAGECNSAWGKKIDGRGIFTQHWLKLVHERIKGVSFKRVRYTQMLQEAHKSVVPTFVFLDPPYHDCQTTYNGLFFNDFDFTKLADMLKNAPFKWLLTINDDGFIRKLFKRYDMIAHDVFYPCGIKSESRKYYPELIVANYALDRVPPLQQLKLFQQGGELAWTIR